MESVFSLFRVFNMAIISGVRSFRFWRNHLFYKTMLEINVCCEYPTGIRNVHNDIIEQLSKSELLIIKCNKEKCNVSIVFCPIVSRAGTDIEATLSRLSGDKPTIVLVLHHTFDPDYSAPNSSRYDNNNLKLVDILFHEDSGLLKCSKNDEAITEARHYLKEYAQQLVVHDKHTLRKVIFKSFFLTIAFVGICVVYRKCKGFPVFPAQSKLH